MQGFFSKLKNVEAFVFLDAAIENFLPQIGENSEIHALLEGQQFWNVIIFYLFIFFFSSSGYLLSKCATL